MSDIDLPQRMASPPPGVHAFNAGILVGPCFLPMDMVGVQTVFGFMPGGRIHLLSKTRDMVEGFPSWWTRPTTTFDNGPATLDVLAVPMLPPEIQNDPEVVAFLAVKAVTASYVNGICNVVLALGAAGVLEGRRVTASHNALPILSKLGAAEVVPGGNGTVVDGNLYTAGPATAASKRRSWSPRPRSVGKPPNLPSLAWNMIRTRHSVSEPPKLLRPRRSHSLKARCSH